MITFLGDVAILNDEVASQYKPEGDYIPNFEYVIDDQKHKLSPIEGKINICSPHYDMSCLFGKKPIAVCVANNHMLDFGIDGYETTLKCLQDERIETVGDKDYWYTPTTCIFAYSLFSAEINGKSIFKYNQEKAREDILNAKNKGATTIVVIMHWGIENHPSVSANQMEIGHWLIDCGATLVIGNHPHCIQPVEEYSGRYIFYSLGNCIFPPFSIDCNFDENGISQRRYRFKWQSWNNTGLAVVYDDVSNKVIRIEKLKFIKNTLVCDNKNLPISDLKFRSNSILCRLVFVFRKYWLFFVSNSFVDGKLFDINALKQELHKR